MNSADPETLVQLAQELTKTAQWLLDRVSVCDSIDEETLAMLAGSVSDTFVILDQTTPQLDWLNDQNEASESEPTEPGLEPPTEVFESPDFVDPFMHRQAAAEFIGRYVPGGEFKVGKLAFTLGNGSPLPRDQFGLLIDYLNAHPRLIRRGDYFEVTNAAYERVPQQALRTPIVLPKKILDMVKPEEPAVVEENVIVGNDVTQEVVQEAELPPPDFELTLRLVVDDVAARKGFFNARDIKNDPRIAGVFSDTHIKTINAKLLDRYRDDILERLASVGTGATWLIDGSKKALAFYGPRAPIPEYVKPVDATPVGAAENVIKKEIKTTTTPSVNNSDDLPSSNTPAENVGVRSIFQLRSLLNRQLDTSSLSEQASTNLKDEISAWFDNKNTDSMTREELLGIMRLHHSFEDPEAYATILQKLYNMRLIGKTVNGQTYFHRDPLKRRGRTRNGSSTQAQVEERKRKEDFDPIDAGAEHVMDHLVDALTHVSGALTPYQVSEAIRQKTNGKILIDVDDVKKICRTLSTYFGVGSRSNKTKHMMVWIHGQEVKDAWKYDKQSVLSAWGQGLSFDQYLESKAESN